MIEKVIKADDVVKITQMFKKAIITCSVGYVISLILIPIGFELNWETPLFVISFMIINAMSFGGVVFFGWLYWREKTRKGTATNQETMEVLAIEKIRAETEQLKVKMEIKTFGGQHE